MHEKLTMVVNVVNVVKYCTSALRALVQYLTTCTELIINSYEQDVE